MPGVTSNYPAEGYGEQSPYYDDEILFDGTYQVISATLDKDSRDIENNPITTLRKGLLLVKRSDGKYEPLNTEDGYLNGVTPTQYMKDVVVLAYEFLMTTTTIKGIKKLITARDLIIPVYLKCNLKEAKCFYNNKSEVPLTDAQLADCGRIFVVPSSIKKYTEAYGELRTQIGVQNVATI